MWQHCSNQGPSLHPRIPPKETQDSGENSSRARSSSCREKEGMSWENKQALDDNIDMCRERDESLDDEVFFIPSFGTESCFCLLTTLSSILDWPLTLGFFRLPRRNVQSSLNAPRHMSRNIKMLNVN